MRHKALWKGHPMRLELTRVGVLVELANHYTTRGALTIDCFHLVYMKDTRYIGFNSSFWYSGNIKGKYRLTIFFIFYSNIYVGKGTSKLIRNKLKVYFIFLAWREHRLFTYFFHLTFIDKLPFSSKTTVKTNYIQRQRNVYLLYSDHKLTLKEKGSFQASS